MRTIRNKKLILIMLIFILVIISLFLKSFTTSDNITGESEHSLRSIYKNYNFKELNDRPDISAIIEAGKRIHFKTNATVLVTVVNDAYLNFTYNWLCNTIHMDIHKFVLLITTDPLSRDKLRNDWPGVSSVALTGVSLSGDQEYSHAGYVRLMVRRTEVLLALLNSGVKILLFETDSVWLKNPLPLLEKESEKYDILVTKVSERPRVVCGCFLLMRPSFPMITTWQALTGRLYKLEASLKSFKQDQYLSEADNDQQYLSDLILAQQQGLTYKALPLELFPDGKWYHYSESKRISLNPYIIHNNWLVGNTPKLDRAMQWSQWFLRNDNVSCDMEEVNKIIQ